MEKFIMIAKVESISEEKKTKNGNPFYDLKVTTENTGVDGRVFIKNFSMQYFGKYINLLKPGCIYFLDGNLSTYSSGVSLSLVTFTHISGTHSIPVSESKPAQKTEEIPF